MLLEGTFKIEFASFEAFAAVKIHVEVLCVVTPCSVVVGYQCFRCHAASIFGHPKSSAETMESFHDTTWRHNPEDLDLKFANCLIR
jgi:hypothetical protein